MKSLSIEEFQKNFDFYVSKVEFGDSFIIESKYGNILLMPHNKNEEVDELIKIHTDHEEGS